MAHTCYRCGMEIPEGGVFYHVKLTAVSGFDGVIDPGHETKLPEIVAEVRQQSAGQLENGVYYEREVILCAVCRKAVIEDFSRSAGIGRDADKNPRNLLH